MSCKKFQKMIVLDHPGELSSREREELARHIASCKNCAALQKSMDYEFKVLRTLRQRPFDLSGHSQMTDAIINSIRRIERPGGQDEFTKWLKRYIPLTYWPRIRFVLSACIFLIVSGFIVQQVWILHRVSNLEKSRTRQSRLTGQVTQSANSVPANFHADLDRYMTIKGDKVLIDKKALLRLLQSYDKLRLTNRILLNYIAANLPEFDRGNIDRKRLEEFINKKKNLQRLLKEL